MNKTGHFNFAENRTFLLCLDRRKTFQEFLKFGILLLVKFLNCIVPFLLAVFPFNCVKADICTVNEGKT
ncbi:MAG: hypothetical protein ACOX2F_09445 [bacterium]